MASLEKTATFDPLEAVLEVLTLVSTGADSEQIRRALVRTFATMTDADVERCYGESWDSDQLREEFDVEYFLAPFAVARRRLTGQTGCLCFRHQPRRYFNWDEDETLARLIGAVLA
jgi:hypothetical protein